jgi:hypothetical protein
MGSVFNEGRNVMEHCWMDKRAHLHGGVDQYGLRLLEKKTNIS